MPDYKLLDFHSGMTSVGMSKKYPMSSPQPHDATIRERILSQDQNHNYSTFSNADGGKE